MYPVAGFSFTENEDAIIAPNSVFAHVTAPVEPPDTNALYEAWSGSPPPFAFAARVYPLGVVIVPIADVSHPQKTMWIVLFATVIAGALIVPVLAESSFAAFAVFGATSKLSDVPEKQIATIPHLPDALNVKAYVSGSPA